MSTISSNSKVKKTNNINPVYPETVVNHLDTELITATALEKAHLTDRKQLLTLCDSDLAHLVGVTTLDAKQLKRSLATYMTPKTSLNGYQMLQNGSLQHWKLSTNCSAIDSALRGGFLSGVITEVCGESASGKTQLCLQLCLSVQINRIQSGGAVYICTEDVFPSRRLQQLIKCHANREENHNFGDNIFIEHVADFEGLDLCVEKRLPALLRLGMAKLVIIDSVTSLFRCCYDAAQMIERSFHLSRFGATLHKLASKYNIPVICVNQVSANMNSQRLGIDSSCVVPALGITWANQVTCRVSMRRPTSSSATVVKPLTFNIPTYRELSVAFAPHIAHAQISVYIDNSGVHGARSI